MERFIARYQIKGVKKSLSFDKTVYDETKASGYLKAQGIQNFMFFWDPYAPIEINADTILLRGDVGFDITTETLLPLLAANKNILLDSMGGSLWEGLKMYDAVKMLKPKSHIGVLGSAASAATPVIMAVPPEQRGMSGNSRFLIHNPWTWEAGDDAQLRATAADLEKEKINLANLYAKESGATVEDMLSLMSEERFLNFEETKAFNFIVNPNINFKEQDMDGKETKAKLTALEATMNKLSGVFAGFKGNGSPVNLVLQDANGTELDFGEDIETKEQVVEGITGVTAGGAPAEGDYVMEDGTTYTFTAGTLDKIMPAEGGDDTEALKQEIADLKQQLADSQNSVATVTGERCALQAKVVEATTSAQAAIDEFTAFKAEFSNDTPPVSIPPAGGGKSKRR